MLDVYILARAPVCNLLARLRAIAPVSDSVLRDNGKPTHEETFFGVRKRKKKFPSQPQIKSIEYRNKRFNFVKFLHRIKLTRKKKIHYDSFSSRHLQIGVPRKKN